MARKTLLVLVSAVAAAGIVATGAAAGAALTGGAADDGFGVAVSASASSPSDDPTSTAPAADAIGRDRAIDIALATTGGGTVVDTEREFEHGRPTWKIEIVKGGVEHKVYVDRETGAIVKSDRDDDRDDSGRGGDDDSGRGGDDDSGRGGDDDSGRGGDDDSGRGGDDDRSGKGRGGDDD
ncbi:PepSY domain-containing protein [Phytohabitans sp. LJ34]|uniref:PepSY domain-containing protein n=1 Tax=Phytohabitans sp. LJ34 TaxID=3452217 RepID=UPI003F8AA266